MNNKREVDCSIVIVNYNTSNLIIDLIEGIESFNNKYSYEFIVVDNASPNDQPELIKGASSNVELINNDINEGFGRANNIGIKLATGRYILLLNSDTEVFDNALDKCLEFMESKFSIENNVGLMGCQLLNKDGSHQLSTFQKFYLWNYLIASNSLLSRFRKRGSISSKQSGFVAGVSGAFMLFRSEVFQKVKPFDPDIFMYSEETELCRKRVGKFFNIYYWADASIIHHGGASTKNQLILQEMVSFALMWYKKGPILYFIFIASTVINRVTDLLLIAFMKADNRYNCWKRLKMTPRFLYYLFFEIPRFSGEWGGRPNPLKVV
ncbi:glycosyltransferase family 2 protein [Marinoscillum sp. MHG1-6]|uniref:glycosyltransferase family 2 protein n=1 Tax=Marinoscillum sp. MHG1-6 TaxID=2959627 RepID=UPI0021573873|nr:glycosyltransferase family 2 protein [Marinoscillum sp. MHG1-6]